MIERDINRIKILFSDGKEINTHESVSLMELSYIYCEDKSSIVAAKVDNDLKELGYHLNDDCMIEFIDLNYTDGMRIYKRSAYFIMLKAFDELFKEKKLVIHHPIGRGVYCEVIGEPLLESDLKKLEEEMLKIVDMKIPFIKRLMSSYDAKEIFLKQGRIDRYHVIEHRKKPYVSFYNCGGYEDYFYGYMAPHTGYIKVFSLELCETGIVLMFPDKQNPNEVSIYKKQEKLFKVFKEYKNWNKILGVENVGALNNLACNGDINNMIRIAEALHEKRIAQIADKISFNEDKKKIVLIAGPSSSGKTTFAKRLSIQLSVNGLKPVIISLDDYFVDRDKTPIDEKGEYDFESIDAVDIKLFNNHLQMLIKGETVEIPKFNFQKGCRDTKTKKLKISSNGILVIEGIHGLNERLTETIAKKHKYKIYVSALTSMNIDDHNRIPTTDTRILRRIVRDFSFRGCLAEKTIAMWSSVRRGEEKNIFPYQEEADIMFNSFLIYEQGVLKKKAEHLLLDIERSSRVYSEARRLIEFLGYFVVIDETEVPINSILREFIGGSCFN
ncbi:MAG: nucleoside kinase [Clostridiales bacterium]